MTDLFQEPDGATPLDPDEQAGLIPTWVTTREDLNQAESDGILASRAWAHKKQHNIDVILTMDYVLTLHKRMFKDVWKWAGKYRTTGKSIGVEANQISAGLMQMLSDCSFWVKNTVYSPDEIAVRLHHQLVFIHPFPNGNGRHSRMMADVLIERLGGPTFTWGRTNLTNTSDTRRSYISALQEADAYNIEPLLKFARS